MIIETGYIRHLHTDDVTREVKRCDLTGAVISDRCAVTIASWWQAPGTIGKQLAALSGGLPVNRVDLQCDIRATRPDAVTGFDQASLDALYLWADRYGR